MAVAPHALASQSALDVLRDGGNAVEAMIAAAATIAVVYPHMNSIGGDSFWLIHTPGLAPGAIDACGAAAQAASIDAYKARGVAGPIPFRGGVAALTVGGTISGWGAAHKLASKSLGGKMPLKRLLADAIQYAKTGIPVTRSQWFNTKNKQAELEPIAGFKETFLVDGQPPAVASVFYQKRLARTLEQIARAGTDDFYRGDLARSIAKDLEKLGSPIALADLQAHQAQLCDPLALDHSLGTLHNMTPPTQGLVSLLILGILDEIGIGSLDPSSADYIHLCVEATKQAFRVRDQTITDPAWMKVDPRSLLTRAAVRELAKKIDPRKAAPWGSKTEPGDTIWMGVIDGAGRAVSFIQSIYHEFGAGIVLPGSGINWQNRGASFSMDPNHINALAPGKKPFHTLNPALARFNDGRVMVYGAMGGDGQPQSQCAVFTRHAIYGMHPQAAVSAPRWLLGRTWGQSSETLKLESRFDMAVGKQLGLYGHDVEILSDWDESMGHAHAIVRHPNGVFEGGADPRSDGSVAAY